MALAAALLWWGFSPVENTETATEAATIAVILDTDIGFSALQLKQGVKQAAKERGLDIITLTPDYTSGDVVSQSSLILESLDEGAKAILLVPSRNEDLTDALKEAANRSVPVLSLRETLEFPGDRLHHQRRSQERGDLGGAGGDGTAWRGAAA